MKPLKGASPARARYRAMSREDRLKAMGIPEVESGTPDIVNHPPHYTATAIEPIDAIEAWGLGFHLGNCVKYVARAELKGAPLEDLKKARWYLDREINNREAGR